jgi:hypothetical protein
MKQIKTTCEMWFFLRYKYCIDCRFYLTSYAFLPQHSLINAHCMKKRSEILVVLPQK